MISLKIRVDQVFAIKVLQDLYELIGFLISKRADRDLAFAIKKIVKKIVKKVVL